MPCLLKYPNAVPVLCSSKQFSKIVRIKMVHFNLEGKGYKNYSFKLPVSTVRNMIRKRKIKGTVEVKERSGLPRNKSDRMSQDLVRNAQKKPHITAKELQQRVADTGLAVHRTIQLTLNKQRQQRFTWP